MKVEELVFVYEKLINSENFGIYNIASPLKSYHRRLIDICNERKINFEKYVTKTQGSTYPLEQDINSQKFEKVFNFKFT